MFRTVPLSIIRSVSLYTQQWYMSYSLRAGSGRNWFSSQNQTSSVLILLASCMTYTIAVCTVKKSWWWTEELPETCRIRTKPVPFWSCSQAVWHIPLLCLQWKIPDDGQRNCPKHVEFYSKNKFENLMHLVGFIVRICHDARSPERQIYHDARPPERKKKEN